MLISIFGLLLGFMSHLENVALSLKKLCWSVQSKDEDPLVVACKHICHGVQEKPVSMTLGSDMSAISCVLQSSETFPRKKQ